MTASVPANRWRQPFLGVARILAVTTLAGAVVKLPLSGQLHVRSQGEGAFLFGLWEAASMTTYWGLMLLILATLLTRREDRPRITPLFGITLLFAFIAILLEMSAGGFGVRS